jgi:hypothetical protein
MPIDDFNDDLGPSKTFTPARRASEFVPGGDSRQSTRSRNPQKRGSKKRRRKRHGGLLKILETAYDVAEVAVHGLAAVFLHTLQRVPANPVQSAGFLGVLICVITAYTMKEHKDEELCFKCIVTLAVIAIVILTVEALKGTVSGKRLRETQDERLNDIRVTPLSYSGGQARDSAK